MKRQRPMVDVNGQNCPLFVEPTRKRLASQTTEQRNSLNEKSCKRERQDESASELQIPKACALCFLDNKTKLPYCNACHKFAERARKEVLPAFCKKEGRCENLKKCKACRYQAIKKLDYNFANGHKTADAASSTEDSTCGVCGKIKDAQRSHCSACSKFAQRMKAKAPTCKSSGNGEQCNGVNGSLDYCRACRYREILKNSAPCGTNYIRQKRSIETSPDLLMGMCLPNAKEPTLNLQSSSPTPMTSPMMLTSSSALLPSSYSQVTTPCAQFPTPPHNQLVTSSVGGGFVNYQALPYPSHQQYQRIPYQNHVEIQQQNKGNLGGVQNSRVPDLYGLNQKSSMNHSQANYLQNGFGMTGSYSYLHNYHWMNQNAHSSLQPGSTIGNMEYSQFPNVQNLQMPQAQSHNLNGNVDQLNYANNGYNGMTMGHHWNPAMSSMQNYYMNGSPSAQVPQQSQIQEQKPQLYNGHPNLPQNFVTNPAAGPSSSNSLTSHGRPPTTSQSGHADYSPSSSYGHPLGNPNSASLMPFDPTNVDGWQKRQSEQGTLAQYSDQCSGFSWPSKDELDVYLGPGHRDFQSRN